VELVHWIADNRRRLSTSMICFAPSRNCSKIKGCNFLPRSVVGAAGARWPTVIVTKSTKLSQSLIENWHDEDHISPILTFKNDDDIWVDLAESLDVWEVGGLGDEDFQRHVSWRLAALVHRQNDSLSTTYSTVLKDVSRALSQHHTYSPLSPHRPTTATIECSPACDAAFFTQDWTDGKRCGRLYERKLMFRKLSNKNRVRKAAKKARSTLAIKCRLLD